MSVESVLHKLIDITVGHPDERAALHEELTPPRKEEASGDGGSAKSGR